MKEDNIAIIIEDSTAFFPTIFKERKLRKAQRRGFILPMEYVYCDILHFIKSSRYRYYKTYLLLALTYILAL